MTTTQHLAWGNILFDLNHNEFRQAFADGRRYYYADMHTDHPERAITLTALDVLSYVLVRDTRTGQYRFDHEGKDHPVETLGVFLGYATAPFFPETPEEQARRLEDEARVQSLPAEVLPLQSVLVQEA